MAKEDQVALAPDLAEYQKHVAPLIKKYCLNCHGIEKQKGDVRFDTIDSDLINGKSVSLWKDILHRLETGEMPPEKKPQPSTAERDATLSWIRGELRKHVTAKVGVPGRVVMRRLSRNEYRNTLRDLLGLNYDIGRELPPDTTYHGFDHVASVQELSRSQLEQYLNLARYAIDKAIIEGPRPLSFSYHMEPELDKAGLRWRINSHKLEENLVTANDFAKKFRVAREEKKFIPDTWHRTYKFGFRFANGRLGSAEEFRAKNGVWLKAPEKAYNAKGGDWGRLGFRFPYVPRDDGIYRLRIKAGARIKKGLGTPLLTIHVFKKFLADVEVKASADDPQWYEFIFAERDLHNVQIHSDDNRFSKTPITDLVLNNGYENPGVKKGRNWTVPKEVEIPAVFIDSIELETNYVANWPPTQHRRILFPTSSTRDETYAKIILERFMTKAFRRPVRKGEIESKLRLFRRTFSKERENFIEAIKEPLVATLVSPQFLFIAEDFKRDDQSRRQLEDYELASRLSYFLWSTMPDEELITLASQKELNKPKILQIQIDRLLNDPRAKDFHRGFTTQWLGLQKLDELMIEDRRWVTRTGLRTSMHEEPAQFFAELLRGNLSLLNLIDSDFVMINERLAQHYKIADVYGNEFRKVKLKPEDHRGGLLTQAASLTISTDGMITNPIYRGKWVLEKILDLPPPPAPANVPPLDDAPKVRLGLREQLAQHRENPSCASCHKKIDPVGWPFERYSILGEFNSYGWGPNWTEFNDPRRNKKKKKPDLHGIFPDGTRVETVQDVKNLILEKHQDDVLRSVTKNMLIYALGRPLDISDDPVIDKIITHLKKKNLGTRELVKAVVLSQPFLEK